MIEPQKYLFCFLNPKDLDNQLVQEGRKEGVPSWNIGYFLLHACMCNFSNLRNFTNKQDEISKNYNIEIWSKWKLQDSAAISWTKIIAEYCNIHLIKTQIEFFEAPSSFHTTSETDIHCWRQSTKVLESSIVSH